MGISQIFFKILTSLKWVGQKWSCVVKTKSLSFFTSFLTVIIENYDDDCNDFNCCINSLPSVIICWSSMQTVWTQIGHYKMSGLTWIQTIRPSDGVPDFFVEKDKSKKK